jgi:pimeloyl-ACP methyl ester carboxylesterase
MHLTLPAILLLIVVLLGIGVLLWISLCLLMAWSILTPPRMTAGKAIYHMHRLSPGDLGLSFEERLFHITDERAGKALRLAGWWIPASPGSRKTALLIHGYADAKVGAIAFAPLLNQLDFNILAIDLRAHGDSQGRFCTAGFFEREDLNQVINQLRAEHPNQTEQLILFGISLGGSVAAATAAMRSDIDAVILESPFPSYDRVVLNHTRLLNLPAGMLLEAALATAQKMSGADFDAVRLIDQVKKIACPVMMVVAQEDTLLTAADVADLQRAAEGSPANEFWLVPDANHLQAMATDPAEYAQRLERFLKDCRPG